MELLTLKQKHATFPLSFWSRAAAAKKRPNANAFNQRRLALYLVRTCGSILPKKSYRECRQQGNGFARKALNKRLNLWVAQSGFYMKQVDICIDKTPFYYANNEECGLMTNNTVEVSWRGLPTHYAEMASIYRWYGFKNLTPTIEWIQGNQGNEWLYKHIDQTFSRSH